MGKKERFFANLFGGSKSSGCCNMEIVNEDLGNCCGSDVKEKVSGLKSKQADILILGPGCKNCKALEVNVKEALAKMGKNIVISHITDFNKISEYGIMSTPGLVVKGKVVSSGKVLKPDDIIKILEKNL